MGVNPKLNPNCRLISKGVFGRSGLLRKSPSNRDLDNIRCLLDRFSHERTAEQIPKTAQRPAEERSPNRASLLNPAAFAPQTCGPRPLQPPQTPAPVLSPVHSPPTSFLPLTSSLSPDHIGGRPPPERTLLTTGEDASLAASTRRPFSAQTTLPFLCSKGIWRWLTTEIGGRAPPGRTSPRLQDRHPRASRTDERRRQDRRASTAAREYLRAPPRPL
jgi:hypothetical protein